MNILNIINRIANNEHAKELASKADVNLNDVIIQTIQAYSETYSDHNENEAAEFIISQVISTLTK
jgi:hypothetical protein